MHLGSTRATKSGFELKASSERFPSYHSSSSSARMTASVTPDGYLITVSMIVLFMSCVVFQEQRQHRRVCGWQFEFLVDKPSLCLIKRSLSRSILFKANHESPVEAKYENYNPGDDGVWHPSLLSTADLQAQLHGTRSPRWNVWRCSPGTPSTISCSFDLNRSVCIWTQSDMPWHDLFQERLVYAAPSAMQNSTRFAVLSAGARLVKMRPLLIGQSRRSVWFACSQPAFASLKYFRGVGKGKRVAWLHRREGASAPWLLIYLGMTEAAATMHCQTPPAVDSGWDGASAATQLLAHRPRLGSDCCVPYTRSFRRFRQRRMVSAKKSRYIWGLRKIVRVRPESTTSRASSIYKFPCSWWFELQVRFWCAAQIHLAVSVSSRFGHFLGTECISRSRSFRETYRPSASSHICSTLAQNQAFLITMRKNYLSLKYSRPDSFSHIRLLLIACSPRESHKQTPNKGQITPLEARHVRWRSVSSRCSTTRPWMKRRILFCE